LTVIRGILPPDNLMDSINGESIIQLFRINV
jgi:hypothetical protein